MRSVLAVASVVWSFTFARGLIRRLLPVDRRDWLTLAAATSGFSVGIVTLTSVWAMMLWPGGPAFGIAAGASGLLWLSSRVAGSTPAGRTGNAPAFTRPFTGAAPFSRVLGAATLSCCAAILFNAAYWPFDVGDALALYAPFGRHLYETATLPSGEGTYETYPMLVPAAFALTHWAGGSVNEYIARIVPALMAVGVVGTGGVLARDMDSRGVGLLASALIAFTPVFARWASTGYTDAPAALYVGLTAIFAFRWWQTGAVRPLLLASLSAGLAMWTKNSTLTLLPSLLWLVASRPFVVRPAGATCRTAWRDAGVVLAAVGLTAGPWYLRNLFEFGFLVPPTILADRARHTPAAFFVMLDPDQHFGLSGWVYTAAMFYGLAKFVARASDRERWFVPLALALPFIGAWWWFASYEARFLIAIVPLLAAMGAIMIADGAAPAVARATPIQRRAAAVAVVAVILVASAVSLRKAVEHKTVLMRRPWMDDVERHRVRVGGLYDLAMALNGLPPASRIGGVPPMAGYYLERRRFAKLEFATLREAPVAFARDYDFVVYRLVPPEIPAWQTPSAPLLHTPDGYVLYATREPAPAPAGPRTGDQ
jgi:hypothetical protein